MKIAFTTSGDNLEAALNPTFGRAPKFLIYDLETKDFTVINNDQNLNASQGAGVQSAQTIANSGAKCLVSGHCGPKAFRILSAAEVNIYYCDALSVGAALAQYQEGKLTEASSADVDGHQ